MQAALAIHSSCPASFDNKPGAYAWFITGKAKQLRQLAHVALALCASQDITPRAGEASLREFLHNDKTEDTEDLTVI